MFGVRTGERPASFALAGVVFFLQGVLGRQRRRTAAFCVAPFADARPSSPDFLLVNYLSGIKVGGSPALRFGLGGFWWIDFSSGLNQSLSTRAKPFSCYKPATKNDACGWATSARLAKGKFSLCGRFSRRSPKTPNRCPSPHQLTANNDTSGEFGGRDRTRLIFRQPEL